MRWVVRCAALVMSAAALLASFPAQACCPAPPSGERVVNADQTVVLLWDEANRTEHFVRRAAFKGDAGDFGFLVPTPSQPDLAESGDEVFPFLQRLTAPETKRMPGPGACSRALCAGRAMKGAAPAAAAVQVLEEKTVAGFHAVALEAGSAGALVGWLKEHGYAFSPEVEAWAKPYVDRGWKITALRVAKGEDGQRDAAVTTAALRISFKTDRPLFPYREPDFKGAAEALGARARLLRIYFVSAARYDGELSKEWPWTGKVAWADELRTEDRTRALELLKLPPSTGPAKWWLTEFEDPWPYRPAPADLYFAKSARQEPVSRPPIIEYTGFRNDDRAPLVFAAVVALPFVARRLRRRPRDRR